VNETKVGISSYERLDQPSVRWKGGAFPYHPVGVGNSPVIQLPGYTIGANTLQPFQYTQDVRDDFTTTWDKAGRHDVKIGGEYFRFKADFRWCNRCMGEIDARNVNLTPAQLQAMFPVWNDASTWNLAPLAGARQVFYAISDTDHRYSITRNLFSGWLQDDWKVGNNLTLNLGVRYDWDNNSQGEKLEADAVPAGQSAARQQQRGAAHRRQRAYRRQDLGARRLRAVLRVRAETTGYSRRTPMIHRFEYQIANNGRPDFATNFFGPGPSGEGEIGGPKPTWEQALATACDLNGSKPGCIRRAINQEITYPGRQTPYSHQASVGVQRQITADSSLEVNYVYTQGHRRRSGYQREPVVQPRDRRELSVHRHQPPAVPDWGIVLLEYLGGYSNYHGTDFTFTKRFSHRWQATATYTLAYFKDGFPIDCSGTSDADGVMDAPSVGFPLAPDLGGDYGYAGSQVAGGFGQAGDQRHRACSTVCGPRHGHPGKRHLFLRIG
jgi:hypothetical protein